MLKILCASFPRRATAGMSMSALIGVVIVAIDEVVKV